MAPSRTLRALAASGAALGIEMLSSTGPGKRLDGSVFGAVNRHRSAHVDRFFGAVTELGSLYAAVSATAALVAARRERAALRALGSALSMWGLGQALKKLVFRARPYEADPELPGLRLLIARPRGTSWPSSHPAVVLAFVATAWEELGLPRSHRAVLAALAGTVALSRVALGVHYPSDVVGGLLLGRAVSLAASGR